MKMKELGGLTKSSRKRKMAIDIRLTFLKIVGKSRNRDVVPRVGSAGKETVRLEVAIASR